MNKRVRKDEVIQMLKDQGYDRPLTLRKTWEQVNGIVRRGWFIATLYGWKYLGDTLAEAQEYLTLEQEEKDSYRRQIEG